MRYRLWIALALLVCCAGLFALDYKNKQVWQSGTIEDELLVEISGLAASATHKGIYWGINDSANAAILFALKKDGKAIGRVAVQGGPYRDIEALGYGNCAFAPKCIFIADIGDNSRERRRIRILIIKEPELNATDAQIMQTIYIEYKNGPRNAEAVFIRPSDGEIFIIEKRQSKQDGGNPLIYRIPRPGENLMVYDVKAEPFAQLSAKIANGIKLGSITDASFLNNSKGFFVRDYSNIYFTKDQISQGAIIKLNPIDATKMPQSEAIAVSHDDKELVITSEGRHSKINTINIGAQLNGK